MRAHAEQAKQNQASGRAIQRATKNTPGKQKTEAKQIKQAKQAQVSKHTSKANQQGPRKNNARRTACLLYTSPSPRDKRQSRMPSSA